MSDMPIFDELASELSDQDKVILRSVLEPRGEGGSDD